jgi:serine/threonine protein kinase
MSQLFTCPKGHQWQITVAGTKSSTLRESVCPVCGGTGASVTLTGLGSSGTANDQTAFQPHLARGGFPDIPGYEILQELGRGGMGVVYMARQRSLNRLVALKMILSGAHAGSTELTRFRREAEAVARLQHPNFVHIYDIGEHNGTPFFSLEFVDGGSLAHKVAAGPVPFRDAAQMVELLARAMHRAHQQGIVHRDLKPANVLLNKDGSPKIADFGLAKKLDDEASPTVTGAVLGTPSYMSPEQARGIKQIGPGADIYSLGVILYELLTGRPPFKGESTFDTMYKVVWEEPQPPVGLRPEVPPQLQTICLKCLAKEPEQRFPTAEALADALHQYLRSGNDATSSEEGEGPIPGPRRSTSLMLMALIVILIGGALGGALYFFQNETPPNSSPQSSPITSSAPTTGATRKVSGWEVLPTLPGPDPIVSISFPTPNIGYAASHNTIYRTADGGQQWQSLLKDTTDGPIHFVYFIRADAGWYGNSKLRRTSDSGATWIHPGILKTLGAREITVLEAAGTPPFLIGGGVTPEGSLFLFRRSGNETEKPEALMNVLVDLHGYWGGKEKPYRTWHAVQVAILGQKQAMVILRGPGEESALVRTGDTGDTWTVGPPALEKPRFVCSNLQGRAWAASATSLWHCEGPTRNLEKVDDFKPEAAITGLSCSHRSQFVVALLANGKVMLNEEGKHWQTSDPNLGTDLKAVVVPDPSCAYILTANNRLARYTRAGVTPMPEETTTP